MVHFVVFPIGSKTTNKVLRAHADSISDFTLTIAPTDSKAELAINFVLYSWTEKLKKNSVTFPNMLPSLGLQQFIHVFLFNCL